MDREPHENEPFDYIFLKRRDEIIRLVQVSSFAMANLEGLSRLGKALKRSEKQVAYMKHIEEQASLETSAGYPLLHASATVLLWGALEAAIRDLLVRWLDKNPEALQVEELKKIRVSVSDYESLQGEDKSRYLLGIIEREWAAALKPGVGRFECLLKPFGIVPLRDQEVVRDLAEMAAVRNVIVHRASSADKRFLELCPWLGYKEGDIVLVSSDAFKRYVKSATEYAIGIIHAVREIKKVNIPYGAEYPDDPDGG